jgi:hypothetical protein
MTDFAFVAGGRMHVSIGGAPPRELGSAYADSVRGRVQDIHRRHSWKGEGAQGGFGAMAWGRQPGAEAPTVHARVTGLTRGPSNGHLMYTLDVDSLTAVCSSEPCSGQERRLLHGSATRIRHLSAQPERDEVACSVMHADGTASIALMSREASDLRQMTEGESRDLCPSWADDGTARIAYQASGLGRDAAGRPAGFGRFEIHVLDIQRGEVATAASDAAADLERPRIGADGSLYYLSRPHAGPRSSVLRMAWDLLLLPARLVFAIFQYLNFFSARYTGKPLMTAGGAKAKTGDLKQMLQWANLVDAEREGSAESEEGAVPQSHRLMRRRGALPAEVVVRGVSCYDLAPDGSILYASGAAVFRLDAHGQAERLCDARAVDSLVAF